MAKPKPPHWLTASFADGVIELAPPNIRAYKDAYRDCWLAQFDERRRPCEAPLERAHMIPGQRVEHALGALLPGVEDAQAQMVEQWLQGNGREWAYAATDLILLAAWDPRNGVIACQHHHRRYDSHATPELRIHAAALPDHAIEFIYDWGLESEAERRFDNFIRY